MVCGPSRSWRLGLAAPCLCEGRRQSPQGSHRPKAAISSGAPSLFCSARPTLRPTSTRKRPAATNKPWKNARCSLSRGMPTSQALLALVNKRCDGLCRSGNEYSQEVRGGRSRHISCLSTDKTDVRARRFCWRSNRCAHSLRQFGRSSLVAGKVLPNLVRPSRIDLFHRASLGL
jgi:hypothetical protein